MGLRTGSGHGEVHSCRADRTSLLPPNLRDWLSRDDPAPFAAKQPDGIRGVRGRDPAAGAGDRAGSARSRSTAPGSRSCWRWRAPSSGRIDARRCGLRQQRRRRDAWQAPHRAPGCIARTQPHRLHGVRPPPDNPRRTVSAPWRPRNAGEDAGRRSRGPLPDTCTDRRTGVRHYQERHGLPPLLAAWPRQGCHRVNSRHAGLELSPHGQPHRPAMATDSLEPNRRSGFDPTGCRQPLVPGAADGPAPRLTITSKQ